MDRTEPEKYLLIDGSSLLFRAFYAIRNLRTRDGIMTNGVYGFLSMLFKAQDRIQPQHMAVAFDRAAPTFRAQDYDAYKANRQETPSDLVAQFGMLKDVLNALRIFHIDQEGFEADDLIGTMARHCVEKGGEAILLTGDRDYFQLVNAHTRVLYTVKGISELEIVDEAWIEKKYGLRPAQLIDVKGLQGDASDNIPGVPGIGEKTAVKLIQNYGSLDGVYENLSSISGKKIKENLEAYRTQAYLSRKLGTIFCAVPLEKAAEDLRLREPDRKALRERFERLEFQRFLPRFFEEKTAQPGKQALPLTWVSPEKWASCAKRLEKEPGLGVSVLADGPQYIHANAVYVGLYAPSVETTFVFDVRGRADIFRSHFASMLQDATRQKVGYDTKAILFLLQKLGISAAGMRDVMVMEYLLDPGRSSYDYAALARTELQLEVPSEEAVLGKGAKRREYTEVPTEEAAGVTAAQAAVAWKAAPKLYQKLEQLGMARLYEEVENPLVAVLCRMEWRGIYADVTVLDALDRDFTKRLMELEHTILREAGEPFNINSPKQLGDILFEKMGLPHGKKTKTGYSTSVDVLESLRGHAIVDAVLAYRQLSKLKSTYVDGLRACIDPDGRIRTTFRQTVTATGRISSTEPNLQNIPVRTEDGRKLRAVFQAGAGNLLVDADYSQIELRVLASLAQDTAMMDAFAHDLDIHRKTAAEVNHIPLEEVTDLQRSHAKAVNFGIIYGISGYGLSQDLGISRKEAQTYIDNYKNTYPRIRDYMEEIIKKSKEQGYVETAYGRRRYIPELASRNFSVRSFGERVALNTPIQGTAADIIKIAMVRVDRALQERHFRARLLLQIHDELIIEAPEDEAEEVGALMVEIMEGVADFPVKLRADMNMAKSWYDAK